MYNLLTGYRFALRYLKGGSVADVRWEQVESGTSLLATRVESLIVMGRSGHALDKAPSGKLAENVSYRWTELPNLPCPNGHFDAVIALEVIEHLEDPISLVTEVKRVLRPDGTFVLSTPDKQAYSNDRNHGDPAHKSEMYVAELEALLESNFEHVRIFRQGVVAGGVFLAPDGRLSGAQVETAGFLSPDLYFGSEPLQTHFVVAVCSDVELPEPEKSRLLLDLDRRVFDECDDCREGIELLRQEIRRMEETEIQAFQDAVRLERREVARLKSRSENLRAENEILKNRILNMESTLAWRLRESYRRLRAGRGSAGKSR